MDDEKKLLKARRDVNNSIKQLVAGDGAKPIELRALQQLQEAVLGGVQKPARGWLVRHQRMGPKGPEPAYNRHARRNLLRLARKEERERSRHARQAAEGTAPSAREAD